MLDEIKNNGGQENGNGQEEPSRSEKRHQDLADKLVEQEKINSLKLEEEKTKREKIEKELADMKFENEISSESQKYPHAKDYKDEIKSYTSKGLSVSEATTLVLQKNNKLVTAQDVQKTRTDSNSFGGSASTVNLSGETDPSRMKQEDRRAALEKLEQEGKFGLKDGGIFTA